VRGSRCLRAGSHRHEVPIVSAVYAEDGIFGSWEGRRLERDQAGVSEALPHAKPYTPLFMVCCRTYAALPAEGFGVQYEAAFFATAASAAWPGGNCTGGYIVVDSRRLARL